MRSVATIRLFNVSCLAISMVAAACGGEEASAGSAAEPSSATPPTAAPSEAAPPAAAAAVNHHDDCERLAVAMVFQGHPVESERDQGVLARWVAACETAPFMEARAATVQCVVGAADTAAAGACEGAGDLMREWQQAASAAE